MKLPGFIFTDQTFQVVGVFDGEIKNKYDFEDGKGYVNTETNHVWIFKSKKPAKDVNKYPYMWITDDGVTEFSRYPDTGIFNADKIVSVDTNEIIEATVNSKNTSPAFDDSIINDLNAGSEEFHPVLYDKDDFLKKLIKTVLNTVSISLNKYKSRVKQKYMISNMKSALMTKTKMSTQYFNAWVEMLGLKMTVIIESTDDADDKIPEPLVYLSERDNVFKLSELDNSDELSKILENNK